MNKLVVPLKKPFPDIGRFVDTMQGKIIPNKISLVEYVIDDSLMKPILEEMIGRKWVNISDETGVLTDRRKSTKENLKIVNGWLDNIIAFWYHMGYDFVRVEVMPNYPADILVTCDTANGTGNLKRPWQKLTEGPIKNWDDFESYPWPEITDDDFYIHRYICDHLPEGMGFISCHAGGVYEHSSRLLGYEGLCYNLIDNPALIKAVADKIGATTYKYNSYLLKLDKLVAVLQGEDFGSDTQTLISPDHIRKYYLPWHKKFAKQIHESGKYYYFHTCGKVDAIMDDLIDDVKIDGKHSFMEGVAPITQAKELYGDRIALLGGVDMNNLALMDPDKLRSYVREIIDTCSPGGRFALGAGNSIPSYIPVDNYLTMIDEALKY